nr:uncharacterized protein LOC113698229 [Coffea arabica]XP_027077581.1 uncharacterized protein LOC113701230 [Coffea arabica]
METPSSTRRVTRSQTLSAAAANSSATSVSTLRKIEESETGLTKSRHRKNGKQQDRSALIDITNDSPIVGLAMGSLETPSSAMSKKRFSSRAKHDGTPGSGEALLRGQVKTLLQKVEEEAEHSKLSSENRPFLHLQAFINSPLTLAAPTPANTPQILNLSANGSSHTSGLASLTQSPVEENFIISQMVSEIFDGKKQEGNQSDKSSMITRSLILDFSEKSEGSECSSGVTYQGGESEGKERATTDDDDSSIWSIQVNASTIDDLEEDDEEGLDGVEEECDNDYYYDEEEEKEDDLELVDELCDAISKIRVNGEGTMGEFAGKHTRFVYNSDDELEGEEEVCGLQSESASTASPSVLKLKGLPTPKGKHLRFPDD